VSEPFEILEHTADVGFRVWGTTPAGLFENAARALMSFTSGTPEAVEETRIEAAGEDFESLLVNWLSEILYLFDSGRFAPRSFAVETIEPSRLRARLTGEPRDPARHAWKLIVKAVTYHGIEVAERNGRWEATVIVDI